MTTLFFEFKDSIHNLLTLFHICKYDKGKSYFIKVCSGKMFDIISYSSKQERDSVFNKCKELLAEYSNFLSIGDSNILNISEILNVVRYRGNKTYCIKVIYSSGTFVIEDDDEKNYNRNFSLVKNLLLNRNAF